MAIINDGVTIDSGLEASVMRRKMESKDTLATKGALYVGTGTKQDSFTVTKSIAPEASDNDKVLVADSTQGVGWRVDICPKATTATTATTAEKAAGYSQGGEIEAALEEIKARLTVLEERSVLAKIYGVDKVGSENPDALVRTDDAVGLNVTVGTSEITSDFDNCYP